MKKKILIEGMGGAYCINRITNALKKIGAISINISIEEKAAAILIGENVTDKMIESIIEKAGYHVVKIQEVN